MEDAIHEFDLERVHSEHKSMKDNGSPADVIRMTVEDAIHKKAYHIAAYIESERESLVRNLLNFVFDIAKEDLCAKAATVAVLQDVFDVVSIEQCEKLFIIVEDNLQKWKTPLFYEACKNMILRMCNDILKRLSRTVNTSFCGRILVLLARALPLCEKSGLNLISQFNIDNITKYDMLDAVSVCADGGEEGECMEIDEVQETRDVPVDYAFYQKFWQLQTFFSSPTKCFDKMNWKLFQQNTSEVLGVLSSYKLDSSWERKNIHRSLREGSEVDATNHSSAANYADNFFAKYLTSQKLLQLQLNDSRFRRYFLVQCLILYQYLVCDVKFKDKSCALNDEQLRFVIESTDKCYRLLREIHPGGSTFANLIKFVLLREREWSEWKNKGCADYTQFSSGEKLSVFKKRPRSKYEPSKIDLGNPELTRLWNISPNMLQACRDRKRKFVPDREEFLKEPREELDPQQQVEDEYKSINNESFQWRCSRFLMISSPNYFQTSPNKNEVTTKIPHFLERLICDSSFDKSEKESDGVPKTTEPNNLSTVQNGHNLVESSPLITDTHVKELVPLLSKDWHKLASTLNIRKDVMTTYSDLEASDVVLKILTNWRHAEGEMGTIKKLSSLLLMAELLSEKVISVFKNKCF